MSHRVLVIDDHPVVVQGVDQLLAAHPDLQLVGSAHDATAGLQLVVRLRPNAVVLDLRLNDGSGPDTCRRIVQALPGVKVLMHTAFDDLEPLRACLRWGAAGVVFKDGTHLVEALRKVLAGGQFVESRLAATTGGKRIAPPGEPTFERLSPREYDVLCAYALGQSTKEVAQSLRLTENTVRGYTKSLLAKLRCSSRLQALATARRIRLIP